MIVVQFFKEGIEKNQVWDPTKDLTLEVQMRDGVNYKWINSFFMQDIEFEENAEGTLPVGGISTMLEKQWAVNSGKYNQRVTAAAGFPDFVNVDDILSFKVNGNKCMLK